MTLSAKEVARFDEEGYLFLPDVFGQSEVAVLRGELPGLFASSLQTG